MIVRQRRRRRRLEEAEKKRWSLENSDISGCEPNYSERDKEEDGRRVIVRHHWTFGSGWEFKSEFAILT